MFNISVNPGTKQDIYRSPVRILVQNIICLFSSANIGPNRPAACVLPEPPCACGIRGECGVCAVPRERCRGR